MAGSGERILLAFKASQLLYFAQTCCELKRKGITKEGLNCTAGDSISSYGGANIHLVRKDRRKYLDKNRLHGLPGRGYLRGKTLLIVNSQLLSPILLLILLCGTFSPLLAQRSAYVGAGFGVGRYFGDLSDSWRVADFRPAAQLQAGYYLRPGLSLRASLTHGSIQGDDAWASSEDRRARNLSFRSPLTEFQLSGVYEMFPDRSIVQRWRKKTHWSPLIFAGVAGFAFDPRARHEGEWVSLQPLGTEGQHMADHSRGPYALQQLAVPAGAGVSLRLPSRVMLWLEMGYRFTFTDYLDDVSTNYPDMAKLQVASGPLAVVLSDRSGDAVRMGSKRGNPDANDSYFFTTIGIGYVFRK